MSGAVEHRRPPRSDLRARRRAAVHARPSRLGRVPLKLGEIGQARFQRRDREPEPWRHCIGGVYNKPSTSRTTARSQRNLQTIDPAPALLRRGGPDPISGSRPIRTGVVGVPEATTAHARDRQGAAAPPAGFQLSRCSTRTWWKAGPDSRRAFLLSPLRRLQLGSPARRPSFPAVRAIRCWCTIPWTTSRLRLELASCRGTRSGDDTTDVRHLRPLHRAGRLRHRPDHSLGHRRPQDQSAHSRCGNAHQPRRCALSSAIAMSPGYSRLAAPGALLPRRRLGAIGSWWLAQPAPK
jgi:hypothetical protein